MNEQFKITKCWYEAENTGWSGGISWFCSGGTDMNPLRFTTEEEVKDYITKTRWDDESVVWRYVKVTFEREGNREVKTKEWTIA